MHRRVSDELVCQSATRRLNLRPIWAVLKSKGHHHDETLQRHPARAGRSRCHCFPRRPRRPGSCCDHHGRREIQLDADRDGCVSTANFINVGTSGGFIRVDDFSNVTAGAGCIQDGSHVARCSTAGINQIRVSTGAKNDFVFLNTGLFTTVLGGARTTPYRTSATARLD